jgi:hypothetical protein
MNRLKLLAVAGLSLLALSACTGDKNLAAKDPATAAKDLAVAFRENDFDRLSHIAVPPDVYAKMDAKDKEESAKKAAPSPEESKQFADNLAKFTAPDAEDKLFAQVQPMLAQVGPQIPMYVAMGSGGLGQAINSSDKLSADEKTQANAMLTAITKWATTAPLADPDKAKQAIHVVVATARDLKLTTEEAAQKLSFSEKMQKVGIGMGGLRKALAVYGLDTDKALDSVTATKKSEDGDNAVVTVAFTRGPAGRRPRTGSDAGRRERRRFGIDRSPGPGRSPGFAGGPGTGRVAGQRRRQQRRLIGSARRGAAQRRARPAAERMQGSTPLPRTGGHLPAGTVIVRCRQPAPIWGISDSMSEGTAPRTLR